MRKKELSSLDLEGRRVSRLSPFWVLVSQQCEADAICEVLRSSLSLDSALKTWCESIHLHRANTQKFSFSVVRTLEAMASSMLSLVLAAHELPYCLLDVLSVWSRELVDVRRPLRFSSECTVCTRLWSDSLRPTRRSLVKYSHIASISMRHLCRKEVCNARTTSPREV